MQSNKRIYLIICVLCSYFFSFSQRQTNLDLALRHLESTADAWSLSKNDLIDLSVSDQYVSSNNGVHHFYFQQNYQGIPIYNAVTSVHITKEGKIIDSPNRFYGQLSKKINTTSARILPQIALEKVVLDLKLENAIIPTNIKRLSKSESLQISKTNFTDQDINIKLVYQEDKKGNLRLAYDLSLDMSMNSDYWSIRVDAVNGDILSKYNFTIYCKLKHDKHDHCNISSSSRNSKFESVQTVLTKQNTTAVPYTYNVFPLPIESPIHGQRSLLINPADPTASPYGWHDSNGAVGAEYNTTNGNNVNAYLDKNGDNANDGIQVNGGADLIFDFPFDAQQEPYQYTHAATTNLFYVCNTVHDVLYNFGFDEKSGNFQRNNYGKGGTGNDPVVAEAQDGSGVNNANFSTPADGGSGRMQMYLWTATGNEIYITQPNTIAGPFSATRGGFGTAPDTAGIKGKVVWSDTGVKGSEKLSCKDSQNKAKLKGNIAVVLRGECEFGEKAYYAQKAGAIAVIICGFNDENVSMGGGVYGGQVTIPTYYATKSTCDKINIFIDSTLEMQIKKPTGNKSGPDSLDGDFDNGIIAHEYGHGVSNRLTGGPSQAGCLGNAEQMGEGWSDFLSLIFTAEKNDLGKDIRAVGNYAIGAKTDGLGIRRRPYTTDRQVNEFTYKNIDPEVHNLGEVWTTVLWDLYWALSDKYGYDPNFKNKTAGNNICIQLVMDAMKLQPCSPGFIDGRNAIIKADEINNQGQNKCLIWDVFAKRGFGSLASQGSSNSIGDEIEDFESIPECINSILFDITADQVVTAGKELNYKIEIRNQRITAANNVNVEYKIPSNCTYVTGSASIDPKSVIGNIITWEIPSMAALQKTNITFKVSTDRLIYSNTLWRDDLETSGFTNWDYTIKTGNQLWFPTDGFGINNTVGLYAEGTNDTTDFSTFLVVPTNELTGNEPSLYFYHQYNTQNILDGGFIEISTDGVIFEKLNTADFSINGYNGDLSYSTFVVPNLKGYSGNSNGWIPTVVNLSKYAGRKIYLRFRFGTYDDQISKTQGRQGWTIDDLEIINPKYYNTEACVTSSLGDNICKTVQGKGTLIESTKIVGNEDLSNEFNYQIYPNPASEWVNINLKNAEKINELKILNPQGQVVIQNKLDSKSNHELKFSVKHFPKGIYLVELRSQDTVKTSKITIN